MDFSGESNAKFVTFFPVKFHHLEVHEIELYVIIPLLSLQ